jgi:hypothetical protein
MKKLIPATALIALLASTSMAYADTQVTTGDIECYNSTVLTKNVAENSIALEGGAVLLGTVSDKIRGMDFAGSPIVSGDKLQICGTSVVNSADDATHTTWSVVIEDITQQINSPGHVVIVVPAKNG